MLFMKKHAWQRCIDEGYDMSLVEANLRLSPGERLERGYAMSDEMLDLRAAMRKKREHEARTTDTGGHTN